MTSANLRSGDPVAIFSDAMKSSGIIVNGPIVDDGKLHRYHAHGDRKGSRNAWAILHVDSVPAGAFGDYKRGIKIKWSAKGTTQLSREERQALAAKIKADQAAREAAELAKQEAAAEQANRVWRAAKEPAAHPYLTRKAIAPIGGVRVADWVKEFTDDDTGEVRTVRVPNALLIPIYAAKDTIVSLQGIFSSDKNPLKRDKDFLRDGRKHGCYFPIGRPTQPDGGSTVIVICEGYSTGASIHMATGLMVICAFDAGNMMAVATKLRANLPNAVIVLAADNDAWTGPPKHPIENPGVHYARAAATAVGGLLVVPTFANVDARPTDFNDLATLEGPEAVKAQLRAALGPRDPEPSGLSSGAASTTIEAAFAGAAAKTDSGDDTDARDASAHFTLLGYDRGHHFIYQHEQKQVSKFAPTHLAHGANLLSLAPLHWWEMQFPSKSKDGFDKNMAMNWLLRTSNARGIYDPTRIRGRGAWDDEGRLIVHFGSALSVQGVMTDVTRVRSKYVYELSRSIPLPDATALSDEDGAKIVNMAAQFKWRKPVSALLFAGWAALAPLCGALNWRSNIWLGGGPGCGKSTALKEYLHFLMSGCCLFATGNSTEAGIRQRLKKDALPVLFDEAEQNNEKEQQRMQLVLAMVRQAASNSPGETLKGTTTGDGLDFHIRSMFALASVQIGLLHQADIERFAKLALRRKEDSEDPAGDWKKLEAQIYAFQRDKAMPARMIRRSIEQFETTRKSIHLFAEVGAARFGSQRHGDQYGTLLAGAWSLKYRAPVNRDQAERMIDYYDWSEHLEDTKTDDSARCLSALLGSIIRLPGGLNLTVNELVCCAAGHTAPGVKLDHEAANLTLRRYGLRVFSDATTAVSLFLQNDSVELSKLLIGTPFTADWRSMILSTDGARRHDKNVRFSGAPERCISIPMTKVLGVEPSLTPGVTSEDDRPF